MDKTLTRIIRMLLDEVDKQDDLKERVEQLEHWREEVDGVWPKIQEGE